MRFVRRVPTGLRTIGIPFLTFIAGGLFSTIFQDFIQNHVLPSELWILVVVSVCLALIAVLIASILADTRDLRTRLAVKTTYYELGEDDDSQARLFEAATAVVKTAKRTIYVAESDLLESWVDDRVRSTTPKTNHARVAYYSTLLERAVHSTATYERVLQIRNGQPINGRDIGEDKLEHLYQMVAQRDQRHSKHVGLLRAPGNRLLTFVLVDDVYLLWQINEMLEDGQRRMNGILIIEDVRGEITAYFRDFFLGLRHNTQVASVQLSDLPVDVGHTS